MATQDCGPPKWLVDCAWEVYRLTRTDEARDKFAGMVRQWAEEDVRRHEWVGPDSAPKAPPNEEEEAKLYGPPPLNLGPELTLPGKYVVSALVHDFCIDTIRERAGEYVPLLDPWAKELPQNGKYARALEVADKAEEKLRKAEEAGKPKKAITAAKRAYGDAVKHLQTAKDDSAPEVIEGRSFATYQVLRHSCMEKVEEEHQHFIRGAVEAVRDDLAGPATAGDSPRHSSDFRSVDWFGTDYTFTPTQAACVKVLWDNWERGTSEVGEQAVLEDQRVDSAQSRLPHVFDKGKHPAWGKMIAAGSTKGSFRLAEPER